MRLARTNPQKTFHGKTYQSIIPKTNCKTSVQKHVFSVRLTRHQPHHRAHDAGCPPTDAGCSLLGKSSSNVHRYRLPTHNAHARQLQELCQNSKVAYPWLPALKNASEPERPTRRLQTVELASAPALRCQSLFSSAQRHSVATLHA